MKRVVIITLRHPADDVRLQGKIAEALSVRYNVQIITALGRSRRQGLLYLYRQACSLRPEAVICVEPLTMLVGLLLRRRWHCALFYDRHEYYPEAFAERFPAFLAPFLQRLYGACEDALARHMQAILCVDDRMLRHFSSLVAQVQVFRNLPKIPEKLPPRANRDYHGVYAGLISVRKGMRVILQAAALLHEEFPALRVLFVGRFETSEDERHFHRDLRRLNLEACVEYRAPVPAADIPALLNRCQLGFVLLDPRVARYRGALSLKLSEYLAADLPVIADNECPLREDIASRGLGACVRFAPDAVADAWRKLLHNAEPVWGREYVRECLNPEVERHGLLELFGRILKPSLLMLAYFYPPLGGPGAQRPAKWVKLLQEAGWNVDVVSVRNIVFHSSDNSLLQECRPRHFVRTTTLDPMGLLHRLGNSQRQIYFRTGETHKQFLRGLLPLDEKIGWIPFAYLAGAQLLRRYRYDYLMVTMGPFSSGLTAQMLSKRFDIPYIADFRDHWTMHPYARFLIPLHRLLAKSLERSIVRHAFAVTTASRTMGEELAAAYGRRRRFLTVYNGWDDADFGTQVPTRSLHLHYVGNFYGLQSPKYFLDALRILATDHRLPEGLTVTFTGNYFVETAALLQAEDLRPWVKLAAQVPHREAVARMQTADALLMFVASHKGKGVLTGKVFEYLRTGRPILALVPPDGEVAGILREHGQDLICPMESVLQIKNTLLRLIDLLQAPERPQYPCDENYSRRHQIENFTRRITELSMRRHSRG